MRTAITKPVFRHLLLSFGFIFPLGCSDHSYVDYLVDPVVEVPEEYLEDEGQAIEIPPAQKPLKVRYNDGYVFSEVEIPQLSNNQIVEIEHQNPVDKSEYADTGSGVVVPAPNPNDTVNTQLRQSYVDQGLPINKNAPDVSIAKAQTQLRDAFVAGNYTVALGVIEKVLQRYPSHPQFLRAKGTTLAEMGERDAAIQTYEKVQDIAYDRGVEKKLEKLMQ